MWFEAEHHKVHEIADYDMQIAEAIERVDQCVSWPGVASSVLVITSSTLSSAIRRRRPGRGSSANPSTCGAAPTR